MKQQNLTAEAAENAEKKEDKNTSSAPSVASAVNPVYEFLTRWNAAIPPDWDLEVWHKNQGGYEACAGREIWFCPGDKVRGHGGPEEIVLQRMVEQGLIRA